MKYQKVVYGNFIERPNRFVAKCLINNEEVYVHVKNTGRCKELLTKNCKVILEDFINHMGKRKYRYDLISVYKGNMLVNMDSQAPNKVVKEALEEGKITLNGFDTLSIIRPETTFSNSRFDFYIKDINGKEGFIEVKGVTLENEKIASFPDAPTTRGTKHVNELVKAHEMGYGAFILFVIQMEGMKEVRPNTGNDPEFSRSLRNAKHSGVEVLAYECLVKEDSLDITKKVKVKVYPER